jgi:SAM-dependent methyltransferase
MQSAVHSDPTGFETLQTFSQAPAFNHWLYDKISSSAHGKILEIGSGIGNISEFLLAEQSSVYLSDIREEYCQVLEEKFSGHKHLGGIYLLDLTKPDFPAQYPDLLEKFDTVIALNVIEHIRDERAAIWNAKALLVNGGRLIVLVPAIPSLYNSLDRHLGHFRRYTKTALKKCFEQADLKFGGSEYFNASAIPGWWISGSLLKDDTITQGKLRFFNRMVPIFKFFDKMASPFLGISLIASGIKNKN